MHFSWVTGSDLSCDERTRGVTYLHSDMGRFGHGNKPEEKGADEENDEGEEDDDPNQAGARETRLGLALDAFLVFQNGPRGPGPTVALLRVGASGDVVGVMRQHPAGARLGSVGTERQGICRRLLEVLVVHGASRWALPRRGAGEALR